MPGPDNDRRSVERPCVERGGLLIFKVQPGARGCKVFDLANRVAGIRTHELSVLPTSFDLTFDNFRTVRRCRLIWRNGDFLGAALET